MEVVRGLTLELSCERFGNTRRRSRRNSETNARQLQRSLGSSNRDPDLLASDIRWAARWAEQSTLRSRQWEPARGVATIRVERPIQVSERKDEIPPASMEGKRLCVRGIVKRRCPRDIALPNAVNCQFDLVEDKAPRTPKTVGAGRSGAAFYTAAAEDAGREDGMRVT